jgi:hypothetical protein
LMVSMEKTSALKDAFMGHMNVQYFAIYNFCC